jgi:hypothetical protein
MLEQGCTNNFSNLVFKILCTSFYYSKNGLALMFLEEFEGEVPEKAVALAATAVCDDVIDGLCKLTFSLQLECGLHEWKDGYMKGQPFSAALYSHMYNTIKKLIKQVNTDKYHGHKFKTHHEEWEKGGRYVSFSSLSFSAADVSPNSLQLKSDDDDFEDHVGYQVRID